MGVDQGVAVDVGEIERRESAVDRGKVGVTPSAPRLVVTTVPGAVVADAPSGDGLLNRRGPAPVEGPEPRDGLPVTDPNYMPVTRDLSPAESDMIVGWLKRQPDPPVFRIDSVESLRQVLQLAIELEHATIPGVQPNPTVSLRKCSIAQGRDVSWRSRRRASQATSLTTCRRTST